MRSILALSLLSCSYLSAAAPPLDVVYGDDDRRDVIDSPSPLFQELSRSTAAMIPNIRLHKKGELTNITGTTLVERGVCADQRFANQSTAALCSGFLVGPKTLVTAGHCIRNLADCRIQKWVFDFKIERPEQTEMSVPTSQVYDCKRIIARSFEKDGGEDYAVIELSREVNDRSPLTLRKNGTVSKGTSLVVIGHPSGLPTKIADGGRVRSVSEKLFKANLDTFGGNSGSAVINGDTGEVEGILSGGEDDYQMDESRGCRIVKTCGDNDCRGEDVTFVQTIKGLL